MGSPSSRRIVRLIDARDPDRSFVEAYAYRDCPPALLEDVELQWAEAREQLAAKGLETGLASVEHSHWDWRNKVPSVEAGHHMLVAVECKGEAQGIMAVLQAPKRSRLSDEPLLYVDYLESAPWNLKLPTVTPRFVGIGTVLIAEAAHLSLDTGLEGRIGLRSLPQAEAFYKSRCGMTEFGQDHQYFDLTYFEFTSQPASDRLAGRHRRVQMTITSSEERFRKAAEAEGGIPVSAGARASHAKTAVDAGRVFYVDLSSILEEERPAVIAEIKDLVDRAVARVPAEGMNPLKKSS